ncbi:MAG TPA: phosphoglycerate kinase [Pirellulaceae bacterium]|nr:phosphoglycerate kinase [Pirellulaceae bacterium]
MPAVTEASLLTWCRTLLGAEPGVKKLPLQDYLKAIPKLDSLGDLPAGTAVLVRGDVDAKPGEKVGEGDVRLRSMVETLEFGRAKGWKQIIFGHKGRKPEESLNKVAKRLGELLGCEVPLITDWLDEATMTIKPHVAEAIAAAAPGSVLVLENTRQYKIERVLWDAKAEDLGKVVPNLVKLANEFASKVAKVYVNEALSAGSLDASSTVVPAAMDRVALGKSISAEFEGPMMQCVKAQLVVFSGIKIDKLDDLEAMIQRGGIKRVFSAGSLAMALKKASYLLQGTDFCLGVTEDPAHADKPYYIPPARIEQAKRMYESGVAQGIEFVLPEDFVLADGSEKLTLEPGDQQFDIGSKTIELFGKKVDEFIAYAKASPTPVVAFHNGVFGMFEDPRFERGTKTFISQLKRMKDGGVEVYVGGGEGGTALEKYGQPDWVTHCFTAGGTVLNALGSEPIPYLVALKLATK